MSSPAFEKNDTLSLDPYAAGTASQKSSSSTSPFFGVFNRFSQWKADLGLPNPGSVENLQREVKSECYTSRLVGLLSHKLASYPLDELDVRWSAR